MNIIEKVNEQIALEASERMRDLEGGNTSNEFCHAWHAINTDEMKVEGSKLEYLLELCKNIVLNAEDNHSYNGKEVKFDKLALTIEADKGINILMFK